MASVGTSSLFLISFEVLALKLAFYLLLSSQALSPAILDLYAYVGYIFVGCVLTLLSGAFIGSTMYYVALLFNGFMMAVFLMRTLTQTFLRTNAIEDGVPHSKRKHFLLIFGVVQIPLMYLFTQ